MNTFRTEKVLTGNVETPLVPLGSEMYYQFVALTVILHFFAG